jgi:hypothetical protein
MIRFILRSILDNILISKNSTKTTNLVSIFNIILIIKRLSMTLIIFIY